MQQIYLLTGYDRFWGQTRKPWVSIDTERMVSTLKELGHEVFVHSFEEVVNHRVRIADSIVFYTFSQRDNLRAYIRDAIHYLGLCGNTVIPSYELLLCHENKGYQELYRRRLGFGNLDSLYFSSKRELGFHEIEYPAVFKTLTGSNAKGVRLVHNRAELDQAIAESEPQASLAQRLDFLRRRYFRGKKTFIDFPSFDPVTDYRQYQDYILPECRFVLQPFIPGLDCDYRVLVLGERFFISRRLTRRNDFRASGSHKILFDITDPEPILDFATEIYDKVKNPTLAMDIGVAGDSLYVFEFQAQHTGISTILRAPHYYFRQNSNWQRGADKLSYEELIAHALYRHLMPSS
ncbi:MAG: hypothetical protein FJ042_00320 [Candidatus Cloacimonetes bacterium]|nr:hypothetical protein [Candidatus Cloacimonadota bacterium]